ncbi:MAG: nickel pincer cofactor biosynthesis protein LarC [Candidatus Hydrogenedentes bacterium]|nr:nickel pincer cofactor biosynthesis protein LarC [Candidatus Hydrogenedentota bacterium]
MKSVYFDCYSGVSGDMTVGALIDAGADLGKIQSALASLKVPGFRVDAEKILKKGVAATQFKVIEEDHGHGHAHEHKKFVPVVAHGHSHVQVHGHEHGHTHGHSHEHGHAPHRHLSHIIEIIGQGDLPEQVKADAIATFRIIGEAEAAIHGTTIEKIHFHEVGAIDSIVDIVAAHYALHLIGIEQVFASPLHVGSGTVKCAHGIMPVPAPATARILTGIPTYGGAVQGELVTPTGAAILARLAKRFGPAPLMRVEAIGYGSGTKDLPDRANVLRALIGEVEEDAGEQQTISVIEATIDDMSGELWPPLIEAVLKAGARDACMIPAIGKKGRPAHILSVICDPEKEGDLARLVLRNSTTFGVRIRQEKRVILARAFKTVQTPWGPIAVKTGMLEEETPTMAPEFEACRAAAERAGVPVKRVYEAAWAAALKGEFADG